MENVKTNAFSHLTAKERQYMSFPAKHLLRSNLIRGDTLDFGCGFGKDVEQLRNRNINIDGYDPFYFDTFPEKKYDTILCFYVLNVLLPEEQMQVLMDVSFLLKVCGKAYFAVRRDIEIDGYRIHKVHKKPTYQCNIKLPFKSIFRNKNCEIYEYQHYTVLHQGNEQISPFFKFNEPRDIIVESATAFSFFDKYPVNLGHTLVVAKRVVPNYFDLTWKEQMACWLMVNKIKFLLQNRFNPDGFNIGINVNEAAGQTISHVHIHVIPRYSGDVESPKGGVRGIIPSKQSY